MIFSIGVMACAFYGLTGVEIGRNNDKKIIEYSIFLAIDPE